MARFAIKHTSGKFYCEDEGGAYLVNEDEGIISFGNKKYADLVLEDIEDMASENDGLVFTEMGEFPISEFEIVEI